MAMLKRGKAEAGLAGVKATTPAELPLGGRRLAADGKRRRSPPIGGKKGGKA
jgi:hypothetical protein